MSEQALEEQFIELLEHYRGERGALVPLLQGAQAIFGWLPEDVMARVAEAAGEPLSKALGVATFYSQFRLKPHAKNTIRCCHGTACHVSGAPLISQEVERYLGIHAGREHRRHAVHDRRGALRGRLRHGPGGDDQRPRARQAHARQGGGGGQGVPGSRTGGRRQRRRPRCARGAGVDGGDEAEEDAA